ncbi:MAG: hypothetical protein Kow0063_13110 [Anaerolineae bacterium]
MGKGSTTDVNRKSLLSALCFLGGAILIAIGWWDYSHPNIINQWWLGEPVYSFYWERLARTLALVLPLAVLAWWLGVIARTTDVDASLSQRQRQAACGFAAGLAIPIILVLKYTVTWLGMNYGSSIWAYAFVLVLSAVITWLVWPFLKNQRLQAWLDRHGPLIIFIGMLIFVLVYGGLAIALHASFRTHALDLGTMDQAMWNTSRGRPLEYTPLPVTFGEERPDLSPDSRLVGGKLELIFLPLSALYWLWADPRLLIALQTILLASGAVPLYHLAQVCLKNSAASVAITLAYLLYLPLHYVALADFHTSALMVPFLLWAWHAAEQRRWRNYYLAIGIALLCRVDAALVLLGLGLYVLLKRDQRCRHGAVTLLLGLAWLVLDFGLVSPWARAIYGPGSNELLPQRYGQYGQNVPGIAWGLLTHPLDALRSLLEREKLQTMVDLLATLGWTPLLAVLTLLPALPVLIMNLLAASPYQNSILAHYFAPVIPFIFIAAVVGAANAVRLAARGERWLARPPEQGDQSRSSPVEASRMVTLFALTMTFLTGLFFSPMPPGWQFRLAHYYQVTRHEQALAHTLELIPADAIVSAQSGLFPHLSRRRTIYLFPTVADAEYVVLDLDYGANKTPLDEHAFYATVTGLLADPAFHVAAFEEGAILLKRGPGQVPPAFAQALADYTAGLYRSALVGYGGPTRLRADDLYQTEIVLENRGTQSWATVGPYPIYLSYHWWTRDGQLVEQNGLRTSLGRLVRPGDMLAQPARFVTPVKPGEYVLEWDLVHERRTWFGEQGGITLRVDVVVE